MPDAEKQGQIKKVSVDAVGHAAGGPQHGSFRMS